MDIDSTGGGSSCWLYDYGYDISLAAADFMASSNYHSSAAADFMASSNHHSSAAAAAFNWMPQSQSQTHIINPPSSNIRLLF